MRNLPQEIQALKTTLISLLGDVDFIEEILNQPQTYPHQAEMKQSAKKLINGAYTTMKLFAEIAEYQAEQAEKTGGENE